MIRQDGRIHPFRRGVGRLVAAIDEPSRLLVLPFPLLRFLIQLLLLVQLLKHVPCLIPSSV